MQEIISEEQKLKLPLARDEDLPPTYECLVKDLRQLIRDYRAKAELRYEMTLRGSPPLRRRTLMINRYKCSMLTASFQTSKYSFPGLTFLS